MKNLLIFVIALIIPASLAAIDERRLGTVYESEIMPFIAANSTIGQIHVADGTSLSYRAMVKPEANIVVILLGGHTESYIKYSELFYDHREYNASFYALDQRGQGFSDRLLSDREKDHVRDYNSFISDLEFFIGEVVRPKPDDIVFLIGHSFGAAVATAYAERYPTEIAGLILSSPYLSSKAGPFAIGFVSLLNCLGGANQYVPGGGPFSYVDFSENKETHSQARHERKMQDYADYPEIRLGHPTNHWMVELEKLGREVVANAGEIACPTIVFQAEYDEYADRRTQNALISNIADCKNFMLANAYHEILIETDSIRDSVLSEIRNFIGQCCR